MGVVEIQDINILYYGNIRTTIYFLRLIQQKSSYMQSQELPRIIAKPAIHRGQAVLRLYFPYNIEIAGKVRSLPGVQWSNSMKCWYVPDTLKTLGNQHKLEGVTVDIESRDTLFGEKAGREAGLGKERLLVIRYHKGRVRLIFRYDPKMVALIKTLPFYYYDAEAQWWT